MHPRPMADTWRSRRLRFCMPCPSLSARSFVVFRAAPSPSSIRRRMWRPASCRAPNGGLGTPRCLRRYGLERTPGQVGGAAGGSHRLKPCPACSVYHQRTHGKVRIPCWGPLPVITNPYEVITLADSAATRDGASPAHGGTPRLHGNLARATFACTPTSDDQDVGGAVQEAQGGQIADEFLVDAGLGGEVKVVQCPGFGQAGEP